jgi:SOS response regulatory protein OraA/RecX
VPPTVTALRSAGRNRVAVEVDGVAWRTVPAEVVVQLGLRVGCTLGRPMLRAVRRELRRAEALTAATRVLSAADQSTRALDERLSRRGVAPRVRAEAVGILERSGLLDDRRAAVSRARALAERGYGDGAIRADLERRGFDSEPADQAVDELAPEAERAKAIVRRRGLSVRTAQALTAKGFSPETVEAVCGAAFANDP